jgi:hypothetical protein
MASSYRGGCFCGAVRYAIGREPLYACHCHCRSCQRASGAPLVTWATFPADGFVLEAGDISLHRSSPGVTRGFCSHCGTTLSYAHSERPGEIDITVTSLDEPGRITPRSHIWLEDRAPWQVIADDLPQFPRKPS